MQQVSSRFKGHIYPFNLQLSCESPYYMAFRICIFKRMIINFTGKKYSKVINIQAPPLAPNHPKTHITGGRQNIQCLLHSSVLHYAFGKQPLTIQQIGYKAKGILCLPWHSYYRFTTLLKKEARKTDICINQWWFKIFFLLINKLDFI